MRKNHKFILPRFSIIFIISAAILIAGLISFSCSNGGYSQTLNTITVGTNPIELNALIYVADEHGFFKDNRIQLVYKNYDTGVAAVNGLLKEEVDIAMATEFVIVGNAFQKQNIVDLATVDKSILFYLTVRADRGIKSITDLKGKSIGVPRHTIMEFYLGRTLELNGMGIQNITMVDTQAADPAGALNEGKIDAVVTWEPYITDIKKQMGAGVMVWPIQSNQTSFWSVASSPGWVNRSPDLVKRFFKALVQAEGIVDLQKQSARAVIKNRLNYTDAYLETIWPENQFSLSLDQSLITAMEDEARWMIKNNLTSEKQVPDFLNYIYIDGLKAIKPEAVNIIR